MSNPWDFDTPIWYERLACEDYPAFEACPSPPEPPPGFTPVESEFLLRSRTGKLLKIVSKFITSLQWEFNRVGGCGVCNLSMAMPFDALADFGPDYDFQIFDRDQDGNTILFYRGYAESKEPIMGVNDQINLSFMGYSGQLKRVRVNKTYLSTEISLIIKDILDNFIVPNTGITYDLADLVATDFVVDQITFDELADVSIQTLADLAGNFEWGVDRFKKFYFKPINTEIVHVIKVGREVVMHDPIYDFSTIINRVILKGGRVDNVDFVDQIDNAESQDLYGLRTSIVSNSAIITSATAQKYGTELLADSARIKLRSTVTITKNKKLYEKITPIGAATLFIQPISQARLYNDPDAIYGNDGILYGGRASFQIERISYSLSNEGQEVEIVGGSQIPDIATQIKKLQYQIDQLRSK